MKKRGIAGGGLNFKNAKDIKLKQISKSRVNCLSFIKMVLLSANWIDGKIFVNYTVMQWLRTFPPNGDLNAPLPPSTSVDPLCLFLFARTAPARLAWQAGLTWRAKNSLLLHAASGIGASARKKRGEGRGRKKT